MLDSGLTLIKQDSNNDLHNGYTQILMSVSIIGIIILTLQLVYRKS